MLTTTLDRIESHNPCRSGWELLLKNSVHYTGCQPMSLIHILESNGIRDAIWALRCFDYKDYCLFLADVAESVLGFYEKKDDSKAPVLAIEGIRKYHAGDISKAELRELSNRATYAASAASAGAVSPDADYAAASDAAAYAAYAAAAAAAADYARSNKWQEIEQLFIKHFGE